MGEDAPDEYVDPITAEIMDNPVKLPTSGKIVNYSTIYRHLLRFEFNERIELKIFRVLVIN